MAAIHRHAAISPALNRVRPAAIAANGMMEVCAAKDCQAGPSARRRSMRPSRTPRGTCLRQVPRLRDRATSCRRRQDGCRRRRLQQGAGKALMSSVPFQAPMGFRRSARVSAPWAVARTRFCHSGTYFRAVSVRPYPVRQLKLLALLRFPCLKSRQKPIIYSTLISWRKTLGDRRHAGRPVEQPHHRRKHIL
jgi:hypothetical protein